MSTSNTPECIPSYRDEMMTKANVANALKSQGTVVDWDFELYELKKFPNQTGRWAKLKRASQGWVTCACGVQCVIIPRGTDGKPEDFELTTLGMAFDTAIQKEDRATARHYLNEIEKRSRILIRQIKAAQEGGEDA